MTAGQRSPATHSISISDQPIIFGPEVDPYHYVLSANIHRRHLTAEQKRELIAAVLKAQPAKSNRTIAKQTKADHKTVGAVRERLEAGGEIPHHDLRQDARGTQQPAHRARQQAKAEHRANRESALAAKITALPDKRYGVISPIRPGASNRGRVTPAWIAPPTTTIRP